MEVRRRGGRIRRSRSAGAHVQRRIRDHTLRDAAAPPLRSDLDVNRSRVRRSRVRRAPALPWRATVESPWTQIRGAVRSQLSQFVGICVRPREVVGRFESPLTQGNSLPRRTLRRAQADATSRRRGRIQAASDPSDEHSAHES